MSSYIEKLHKGKKPASFDWNQYLLRHHSKNTGYTENWFLKYPTSLGCSSYDILARTIQAKGKSKLTMVDLACGSGQLAKSCLKVMPRDSKIYAIDISKKEIELAKKRIFSAKVKFLRENASKLSIPSSSVDFVLCHMSLMLMPNVRQVIKEVRRILKPGGIFAAVITNSDLFNLLLKRSNQMIAEALYQEMLKPELLAMADKRLQSRKGLFELFNIRTGFRPGIKITDYKLFHSASPRTTWRLISKGYAYNMLSKRKKNEIKKKVPVLFQKHLNNNLVKLRYGLRRFIVTRDFQ